jgi:small redox-active disulfide protein 2
LKELAASHADKSDAEVERELLELLGKKNYIPSSSRKAYGEALVREFRKSLGQPYEPAAQGALRITVVGPGCSQCNRLEQVVMQVLSEMNVPASLDHVTDLKEMAKYGLVRTPALVINDRVVAMGAVPSAKKIKEWISATERTQKGAR